MPADAPKPPSPKPDRSAAMRRLARECEFEFFRATGPGGQHRNTTESGVRLRHLPSGIIAQATERRSQARNREEALERLAVKLAARAHRRRPRVPTKKSKGVRNRELEAKRREATLKAGRKRVATED